MSKGFFSGKKGIFFLLLYTSDIAMFILSVFLAYLLFDSESLREMLKNTRYFLFPALVLLINYSFRGLYRDKRALFDDNDIIEIVYSVLTTMVAIIGVVLIYEIGTITQLAHLMVALVFTFFLTVIARFFLYRLIYIFRKAGYDRRKVVVYGNSGLAKRLRDNPTLGYKEVRVVKSLNELKKSLDTDIVFVCTNSISDELLELMLKHESIRWKIVPSASNIIIEPVTFDEFRDYPIVNLRRAAPGKVYPVIKRAIDIIASGLAILILSPLLIFTAIMIKITMPGPVFFRQERLGKNMKRFNVIKFRSMVKDADRMKKAMKNEVKGLFKMEKDPRTTWFGRLIRRTCIDELPQVFNVFKGDMSLIGPRPHLESELPYFKSWRKLRFNVKPGMTGMWQVNGRHDLNFDKAVLYDIYYVKYLSFALDAHIVLKTIPAIVMGRRF